MTRRALLWCVVLVACGDDAPGLAPVPPTISAGPLTLDTLNMTLGVASDPPLGPGFISIGTTERVDETHYYDPRGDADVTMTQLTKALGMDGAWLVVEGGTRMRVTACDGVPDCSALDIDATAHAHATQLRLTFPVDAGEPLYGTGDAPRAANVAGTVRELSLRVDLQSDSSLNESHVPVPLVLWPRREAGMFIADDRPGAIDLGKSEPGFVHATFTLPARGAYRVYLYTAPAPLNLVRRYVALTSKPAVPPRWAFAPQQWRNVWNSSDEIRDDATQMRTRGIPGSVMWIDNPWQTGYNTFVIDEQRLAQIDQVIAELTAQGYKVVFWSTPYVGTTSATAADHTEGTQRDFFVTDDAGLVVDWPWQNGPGAMVDFTREGATAWWRERIARVIARGAAGFKLDFGEELVPDIAGTVVPFLLAGGDNSTHHNRYAAGYHEAYLGAFPPGEGWLITRAGAWGEQNTNPTIWPGDLDSDFSQHGELVDGKRSVGGLPSAIARGLGLSVSGYPFYGSDIGGFRKFPTTETLIRWAQYASLGTIMQLGGGGKSHNPWDATLFDASATAIYKTYADLHMQLNPLLWTLALQAGEDGTPVTRPARFMYDCACDDAMFLLGDDLLAAPVIEPGATTRTVVLPPGTWLDRATGAYVRGDGNPITVPAPLERMPLWQRAGSIVPTFAVYADTLLPATAPNVTSYADPRLGRELRASYAASDPGELTLHDGTYFNAAVGTVAITGGTQYTVITLDIDARSLRAPFSAPTGATLNNVALPEAADLPNCAAPGCWRFDAANKHLEVRVFVPTGETHVVRIQ